MSRGTKDIVPGVLILPPSVTLLKHVRIPRVDVRKRARIVGFEAGQAIPCALTEVVWDSVLSGETQTTQSMMLAAVKLGMVEPLCAAAREAGFALRFVIPSSLGLLATKRMIRPKSDESEMLLQVESRTVTLLQTCGRDFAVRTWQWAGEVAADRTEELGTGLAQEVTRSTLHFERQCGLARPVRIWFAGEGVGQVCLAELLSRHLQIPAQSLDLTAVGDFEPSVKARVGQGALAEMAGAAEMVLNPSPLRLNLLPEKLRTRQRRQARQPWLVAAGILALAAPMGPVMHHGRLADEAQAKLEELERAIAPLRARERRIQDHLAKLAELESQVSAWQKLRDRRTGWLGLLSDLERGLVEVEDVWLEGMSVVQPTEGDPLKLRVSGRVLDREHESGEKSGAVFTRVKALTEAWAKSSFVATVEVQRFDRSQPGVLGFDCVVVTDGNKPL